MFTRFEEYAATQMLGHIDSPPREQGKLFFSETWQRTLFGLTLALSKEGHFEWEDFRQKLIQSIGNWEDAAACQAQPPWDYYDRFLEALMEVLKAHDLLDPADLQRVLESGG